MKKNWRIPPKHSWYSGVNPGGALNIRNRQHQTTLTRFRTGHLKPLKIENNKKIYPTCPKCSLSPAAPEHILAFIRCTKQDLWERPLLIIKQLEEHELMEFVHGCCDLHFRRLTPGFHCCVKAKTSLQDGDVPIDDTTIKPLFTPQEKERKGTRDKVPRLRWNPWQKHVRSLSIRGIEDVAASTRVVRSRSSAKTSTAPNDVVRKLLRDVEVAKDLYTNPVFFFGDELQ
ncbi:hypothetical protein LAZ67_3004085 [Cordylochernes scorpioides]|uniref:Uncharacterized protein n=1 Tax=Cordylochernes scorpioides TaxID=51811 RepID=A0ABY6KBY9_9ARAC|nr:hypothetical protein LAZ67_3004085 [Cordylochernes scorpioides]